MPVFITPPCPSPRIIKQTPGWILNDYTWKSNTIHCCHCFFSRRKFGRQMDPWWTIPLYSLGGTKWILARQRHDRRSSYINVSWYIFMARTFAGVVEISKSFPGVGFHQIRHRLLAARPHVQGETGRGSAAILDVYARRGHVGNAECADQRIDQRLSEVVGLAEDGHHSSWKDRTHCKCENE